MRIEIDITGPWVLPGGSIKNFVQGQRLVVGEGVPEKTAEDMLRHGYAHKIDEMPRIETKTPDNHDNSGEPEKKNRKKRKKKR
jgi:hypothetical protein